MSNDEIIDCCSNIADWGFNDYDHWEQQSAVYGLLDLYKKQQDKIASLKKQVKLMQNCDLEKVIEKQQKELEELKHKNEILERLLQGNLYEMYLYYKELASRYQANSISKAKIREKIKELEKEGFKSIAIGLKINVLKELLEE